MFRLFRKWFGSRSARRPEYRPRLESLEDRVTPAGMFLSGVGGFTNPAEPFARVYSTTDPGNARNVLIPPGGKITAFPSFAGSVRVAFGDVNGDRVTDIICSQGGEPGTGSLGEVVIFDGQEALRGKSIELARFQPYANFAGGVFVAAVDLNFDGFDELITSPGAGGNGHIKVFNFNVNSRFTQNNFQLVGSFLAYPGFGGEVRLTTMKGTGIYERYIVTTTGPGTTDSDVRLFSQTNFMDFQSLQLARQFIPIPGYTGGLSVAAGDVDGDNVDELFLGEITASTTAGSKIHIRGILPENAGLRSEFVPYSGFMGEIRVGAADVDSDGREEVLSGTGQTINTSAQSRGVDVLAFGSRNAFSSPIQQYDVYEPIRAGAIPYINGVWLSTNDRDFMIPTR